MTPTITKTVDIVLLAAPYRLSDSVIKAFNAADLECIHALNAENCLIQAKNIHPTVVLVDLELAENDSEQIIKGFNEMARGDASPIILLAAIDEFDGIKADWKAAVCDVVFKPIRIKELITRIGLIRDTKSKKVVDELNETERKMILSARKACHELNQPLQYIMGAIQLILLDISTEDPSFKIMNGLQQQSERMAQITTDLMHLIRSI
jgi:DNA-binding response OmpR family regulator